MRAQVRTIACLFALLAIGGGSSENAAIAQGNAGGLWVISLEASEPTCPLLAIEIFKDGAGEAWINGDHDPDPDFPELSGKVKISGGRIETAMTDGIIGKLRMSLRGTISGNQIKSQASVTERGVGTLAGACVFVRKS